MSKKSHKWECSPRCPVCWIDQPTSLPSGTVVTGRLIYPAHIWVDTPTYDVKNRRFWNLLEGLITLTPGGIIGVLLREKRSNSTNNLIIIITTTPPLPSRPAPLPCCAVLPQRERLLHGLGRRHVPAVRPARRPGADDVQPRQHHLRHHLRGLLQERPPAAGRLRRLQLQRVGHAEVRACRSVHNIL